MKAIQNVKMSEDIAVIRPPNWTLRVMSTIIPFQLFININTEYTP